MNSVIKIFQGFLIGIATLVPGVSGGSMAIILNIYDELLQLVNQLHQHVFKSVTILTLYGIGAVTSLYLMAPMMCALLFYEHDLMSYLFIGIMCGGIQTIVKPCRNIKISWLQILFFFIGIILVFLMEQTPTSLFVFETPITAMQQVFLIIAGFIVAVALVLPGLSASFILFMLGIYDIVLSAAVSMYLPILIPLGAGLVVGIFSSAKVIAHCLATYTVNSHLFILGIIVGSIILMFPGILSGYSFIMSLVLFSSGLVLTHLMGKLAA